LGNRRGLEAAAPGFVAGPLGVVAAAPGAAVGPACRRHSRLIVEGARCRVRAMARRLCPFWAITLIVARSSADSCSKCLVITTPISVEVLHLILDSAPYKNGYRDSSWVAMMASRVEKLHQLLSSDGAIFVSIDKVERTPLEQLLDRVFTSNNRIEELIWIQNTNDGKSPTYSTNHEYVLVYAKQRQFVEQDRDMFREPKPGYAEVMELVNELNTSYPAIVDIEDALKQLFDQHKADYRNEIESQGLDWVIEKRNDPWKGLYPYSNAEYRDANGAYIPERKAKSRQAFIWVWRESDWTIMSSETKQSDSTRDPNHFNFRYYQPPHPITGKPCALSNRGWKGTQCIDPEYPERNSFESLVADHRIAFGPDESKVLQQKRMLHEVETNVAKSVFNDYSDGEKQTAAMFGKSGIFLAPKHTNFVSRFILQATKDNSLVVDCFGGSGSSAHAVIETNRIEKTRRKFITVEVNRYFDTLIIPRLVKAGCSSRWANGKALELDGSGLFMRIQVMEQYEDTLENLDFEPAPGDPGELLFDNPVFALRYQLRQMSHIPYCGIDRFTTPFGYQLKRTTGGGEAQSCEVDLVESLAYLLGMDVDRFYRESNGVVMLGHNRRGQSLAIFFRDGINSETAAWLVEKLTLHPADRVFTNDPASLFFEGAERLEAIEAVFARQFVRS
jgi:adenine-specific DNA-methyltransferase